MKRRFFISMLVLVEVLVFVGCGGKEEQATASSNITSNTEEVSGDSSGSGNKAASGGKSFGEQTDTEVFFKVGNNPNNLLNTSRSLAFDEEHIYFTVPGGWEPSVIVQVQYDGTEAKVIGKSGGNFLNIWNGNVYSLAGNKNLRLIQNSLSDYGQEDIYVRDGDYEARSLLVVDGVAVMAYNSGSSAGIIAVDVVTGEAHDLVQEWGFNNPFLGVSEDKLFAFMVNNDSNYVGVWSISRDEMMSGQMEQVTRAGTYGAYTPIILTQEGLIRLVEKNNGRIYKEYLYEDIEDGKWKEARDVSKSEPEWNEEAAPLVKFRTGHFDLAGNLVVVNHEKVAYYPGYDFSKHTIVADVTVSGNDFTGDDERYGIRGDVLYIVQKSEDGSDFSLVTVNADGTSTLVPIVLSDIQPQDEVGLCIGNENDGDFQWSIYTNQAILKSYSGSDKEVEVPAEYQGKPVRKLAQQVFAGNRNITSIKLPETLREIHWYYAFSKCTALESINIPEGITEVGEGMFMQTALKSIDIPESVTRIRAKAFSECGDLENVTLHEGLTAIEDGAFYYCSALREIYIPHSVEFIGEDAFWTYYSGEIAGIARVRGGEAARELAERLGVEYVEE